MSSSSSLLHRRNKSQSPLPGPDVDTGPMFGHSHSSCPNLVTISENEELQLPNLNPPDIEANHPQPPLIIQQNPPQPPPRRFFEPQLSQDFVSQRFTTYPSTSSQKNDLWWKIFKFCVVIGMGVFFLSLFLGISYIFAEQWKSPRTSFVFRNPTANNLVPTFIVLYAFIYIVLVCKYWEHDYYFFNIRRFYVGFLSMDLIPIPRFLKAALVTIYGLLDFCQLLGDWSDLFFVWIPVFYSLASISMLKLFEHEFEQASSLLLEFSLNLVSPTIVQFYRAFFKTSYHLAYLNFSMFLFVMMFALFARYYLNFYIYRPHVAGEPYSAQPPPDAVGQPM